MSDNEFRSLDALLAGRCRPYFVRSAFSELRGGGKVYARAAPMGMEPRWWLGVSLPTAAAIEVLGAFRRKAAVKSPLRVTTELHGAGVPLIEDAVLADLLSGLLEGPDPGRFLTMVTVARDGGMATLPPLRKSAAGATRAPPEGAPMLAVGRKFQALPVATASGSLAGASAAALVSSGTSSIAAQVSPNAQILIANDAIVHGPILDGDGGDETEDVPTSHLPMTTDPRAAYWPDALDSSIAFYAPGFETVSPAPSDDPATSAFSFVYAKSGPVVGGAPALQTGLTATVR
jgi:hypothetical protein